MKLGTMVEIGMVIAAFGFGWYAIRNARAQGRPALQALGLDWHRGAALDLGAGMAITAAAMAGIFGTELLLGAISQSAAPDVQALPHPRQRPGLVNRRGVWPRQEASLYSVIGGRRYIALRLRWIACPREVAQDRRCCQTNLV